MRPYNEPGHPEPVEGWPLSRAVFSWVYPCLFQEMVAQPARLRTQASGLRHRGAHDSLPIGYMQLQFALEKLLVFRNRNDRPVALTTRHLYS